MRIVVLALFFAGCAPTRRSAPAPIETTPVIAAELAPKSDRIACPPGAERKGTPPPDGSYAWCELPSGERHGPWMVWPSGGTPRKVAIYDHGKLSGTWTQWHSTNDALARIEHWVDDKLEGTSQHWHANGRVAAEGLFRAGAPAGRFRAWDPTGRLIHDAIVDAKGGLIVTWDEDNRVEEHWRGAGRNGLRTIWYPNGQKASESELVDNSPHGAFASWYASGKKKEEGQAQQGRAIWQKRWSEDGELEPAMCAHGPCDER